MGNSCVTTGSLTIDGAGAGSHPEEVAEPNNNDSKDGKGKEQCGDYVRKALESQKVKSEQVVDYSDCLLELPAEHELRFNFDVIPINQTDTDESDGKGTVVSPLRETSVSVREVGASVSVHHSESEEEIDISTRTTKWPHERKREFDYTLPDERYSSIFEDKLDVRGTDKRKIVALSDLHLGGSWSNGMDWKLEKYLNGIIETAEAQVACMVFLGDVFEMWLEKFADVPPSNAERVEAWKQSAVVLRTAVAKLVNDCGVKVYYVRGNHDHEITEQDVAAIFDVAVTFVPCTLILRIQTGDKDEQRVRFAHGHEWDIFNSYMLHQNQQLLPDRPIGYYIARAVATAGRGDAQSEVEDLLIGLAMSLLSIVPSIFEDDLVDNLIVPSQHRSLLETLFEGAFNVKDINFLIHAKCKIAHDKWIRLDSLLDYPLLRLCGAMVGKQDVFHMIKASAGDYKKFIRRTDEDVLVLAHTHRWDLRKYKNNRGNQVVYANTGCWTSNVEEFSTVVLDPPTDSEDGSVLIDYGKNEEEKD